MPERKFKAGKVFWTGGLLILFGVLAYAFIGLNRPIPLPPLPQPNGNDDFVKAQNLMVGNPTDVQRGSLEQMRAHLAENDEVLKLVRVGLGKQCRVPISFSTNHLELRSLRDVKRVARLLEAEGRLAELERRTNEAAKIYLDLIRYGQESCRGGVMMDRLVGIVSESIGVNSLQNLVGTLDAATCRSLSKQLQELEHRREPLTDVLRNESEWVRQTFSVLQRVPAMIPLAMLNPTKRVKSDFVEKCRLSELSFTRLRIGLAARAYELDRGQNLKNLNELVPEYLEAIPVDPATGTQLTL